MPAPAGQFGLKAYGGGHSMEVSARSEQIEGLEIMQVNANASNLFCRTLAICPEILEQCNPAEIDTISKVCRDSHQTCNDDYLWMRTFARQVRRPVRSLALTFTPPDCPPQSGQLGRALQSQAVPWKAVALSFHLIFSQCTHDPSPWSPQQIAALRAGQAYIEQYFPEVLRTADSFHISTEGPLKSADMKHILSTFRRAEMVVGGLCLLGALCGQAYQMNAAPRYAAFGLAFIVTLAIGVEKMQFDNAKIVARDDARFRMGIEAVLDG